FQVSRLKFQVGQRSDTLTRLRADALARHERELQTGQAQICGRAAICRLVPPEAASRGVIPTDGKRPQMEQNPLSAVVSESAGNNPGRNQRKSLISRIRWREFEVSSLKFQVGGEQSERSSQNIGNTVGSIHR